MGRDGQRWGDMGRDGLMATKSFNLIDSFRFSCLLNFLFQSKFMLNVNKELKANVHIYTALFTVISELFKDFFNSINPFLI